MSRPSQNRLIFQLPLIKNRTPIWCVTHMISTKLKKILFKLSNLYFPFNNLSPERLNEIVNHIRVIELQQDEILQIKGSKSQDYLYLMEGQIDVICEGSIQTIVEPTQTQRCPVLLPKDHKSCNIIAKSDCIICHANRETLDTIIAWDQIGRESEQFVNYIDLIRNTLVFRSIPMEYIENAFSRMQHKQFHKGEVINNHREDCDAYYLILSGRAEVQHFDKETSQNHPITELGAGDTFGDEALVSGKNLTETIILLEDSEILVLGKQDHQELMQRPLVRTVQPRVAQTMLDNGYKLLDVRFAEEFSENRIPGAQLMPLAELTSRLSELDKEQPYILYCHSGPRSAVAALVLAKNKIEALSLEGGIRDWPYEIELSSPGTNFVPRTRKFH